MKREEFEAAEWWFQVAFENEKEHQPDTLAYLGIAKIQSVIKASDFINEPQLITDANIDKIKKAIILLADAWKMVSNTSLRKYRLEWLLNRAIAENLLGNEEEAIRVIEIGLEADPDNTNLLRQRAFLAYEQKDNEKAETILRSIINNPIYHDIPILLAEVLRKQKKYTESKNILEDFINKGVQDTLKKEALRFLLQLNLDLKDFEAAQKIGDILISSNPENITNLVYVARIKKQLGKKEEAISTLYKAKKYLETASKPIKRIMLADEFFDLQIFEDAANLYEKLSPPCSDTGLVKRYIVSLLNSKKGDKALELCRCLRTKYGPLESVTRIEIEILNDINEIDGLQKVCLEYLTVFPDDSEIRFLLALTYFRTDKIELLDELLTKKYDLDELSIPSVSQLASLYYIRAQSKKALDIMYEMRRKNFSDPEAHQAYIMFISTREKEVMSLLLQNMVSTDGFVRFEDESGHQEWYIIEDRMNPDLHRNELSLEHPLVIRLMGKRVGDEFILEESQFAKEKGKIIEIKSKYIHALQESMARLGRLFSSPRGFSRIKLGSPEKEGDMPPGIRSIIDVVKARHESNLQIEEMYKEGRFPIGVFAELSGSSIIDAFSYIISKPELGIKCCAGTVEERITALSLIQYKPRLIADIITLIILHSIEAKDAIIREFGKLGISQTTLDIVNDSIRRWNENPPAMTLSFDDKDNKVERMVFESEDVERNLQYLKGLKEWIQTNCEVLPCKAALKLSREQKDELNEVIGQPFIDTILIAKESGNLLYSDDAVLRGFALQEFGINGVWTQALLLNLLVAKTLERSTYNKVVIQLVLLNVYYTSIDSYVLLEAARISNWSISEPFLSIIRLLSNEFSDIESSVHVTSEFFKILFDRKIPSTQRDDLIKSCLAAIISNRDRDVLFEKLLAEVSQNFEHSSSDLEVLMEVIHLWQREYDQNKRARTGGQEIEKHQRIQRN